MTSGTASNRFFANAFAAPAAAFVLSRVIASLGLLLTNHSPWLSASWGRQDSDHYLAIATDGYTFFPCPPDYGLGPDAMCGNAGWLPGYPLLIRMLHAVGIEYTLAGAFVSASAFFATLMLVWHLLQKSAARTFKSLFALLVCAVWPGFIYLHAIFPLSLCAALLLASVVMVERKKWPFACLFLALASFTYSTGFLAGAAYAASFLFFRRNEPFGARAKSSVLLGLASAAGLAAAIVYLKQQTGSWNAFFAVQAKYGHGLHNPIATWLANATDGLTRGGRFLPWHAQVIVTTTLVLFCLTSFFVSKRARTNVDGFTAPAVALFWLFPLTMGSAVSLYRADAMLAPGALLLRDAPRWVLIVAVVVLCALGLLMSAAFSAGILI